ncbi:MAG: hypothetical protein CL949_19700 [Erythrobacter sp.]|nr:hypothetical protein [Erythrobacter sp.]
MNGGGEIFAQATEQYVIARAYLPGEFNSVKTSGPKAVILLDPKNPGKNKKMCNAFVEGLPTVPSVERFSDAKALPIFWLLTHEISPADVKNCKALLEAYDFDQAQVLMGVYGRAGSKGPILVAEDVDRQFFAIDFLKANEKDMRRVLATWFQNPPLNGVVVSKTLWDIMRPTVCTVTTSTTKELAAANPDPSKAGTFFDFAANVFKNVNLWAIGALIVGNSFNAALCPSQQSA